MLFSQPVGHAGAAKADSEAFYSYPLEVSSRDGNSPL